jgi:hypothetical protein
LIDMLIRLKACQKDKKTRDNPRYVFHIIKGLNVGVK